MKSSVNANSNCINKPTSNAPMQLGELFAGGVPKLRPTGNKFTSSNQGASNVNSHGDNSKNKLINGEFTNSTPTRQINTSTIKSSLEGKLQMQTNNNSSFLHSKINPNELNGVITNKNKYHTINLSKAQRTNMSNDLTNNKGHAPPVPSSNGKTNVNVRPSGIQRSNSQSGTKFTKPPAAKPPPPPKLTNGTSNNNIHSMSQQPPSLPSKPPPNMNRRPSFGDKQKPSVGSYKPPNHEAPQPPSVSSIKDSLINQGLKPPAPPRNSSNHSLSGQSPNYPPPPPPLSSKSFSSSSNTRPQIQVDKNHSNTTGSNLSRVQTFSTRPPLGPPPPPPPHRTTSNNSNGSSLYPNNGPAPPPPPSQTKVIPNQMRNGTLAPQLPSRSSSITKGMMMNRH